MTQDTLNSGGKCARKHHSRKNGPNSFERFQPCVSMDPARIFQYYFASTVSILPRSCHLLSSLPPLSLTTPPVAPRRIPSAPHLVPAGLPAAGNAPVHDVIGHEEERLQPLHAPPQHTPAAHLGRHREQSQPGEITCGHATHREGKHPTGVRQQRTKKRHPNMGGTYTHQYVLATPAAQQTGQTSLKLRARQERQKTPCVYPGQDILPCARVRKPHPKNDTNSEPHVKLSSQRPETGEKKKRPDLDPLMAPPQTHRTPPISPTSSWRSSLPSATAKALSTSTTPIPRFSLPPLVL